MARVRKISVVTVCLNTRDEVRLTLDSVARQSFPHLEHVLIDGGSTDGTLDIIAEYPVGYLVSEPDAGVYDAMEKGAAAATGDVLIFLNAGDTFFDEETCSHVARFFDQTNADIVFGNLMPVYLDAKDTHDHGAFEAGVMLDLSYMRNRRQLYDESIHHQATFYRKWILDRCSYICEEPQASGEYNLLLSAVMHHGAKVKHISLPVSRFVLGGISTRNFDKEWQKYVGARDALRKLYCPVREAIEVPDENEFVAEELSSPAHKVGLAQKFRNLARQSLFFKFYERLTLSLATRIVNRMMVDVDQLLTAQNAELHRSVSTLADKLETMSVELKQSTTLQKKIRATLNQDLAQGVDLMSRLDLLSEAQPEQLDEFLTSQVQWSESLQKEIRATLNQDLAQGVDLMSRLDLISEAQPKQLDEFLTSQMQWLESLMEAQSALKTSIKQQQIAESARLESDESSHQQLVHMHAGFKELERMVIDVQQNLGEYAARQTRQKDGFASYGFKVFSQWDEDGLIQCLARNAGVSTRTFVEIGVSDYSEANTRFLLTNDNWSGLLIDADEVGIKRIHDSDLYWKYDVTAVQEFVTRENINALLADHGFTGDVGLLSIDVDGIDYWIWDAIDEISPQLVVCEYNGIFGDKAAVTVPYRADFDRKRAHHSWLYSGVSLEALRLLGTKKGYTFVGANRGGNNAFFVRSDVANERVIACASPHYIQPKFREGRDKMGRLTYSDMRDSVKLIEELEVFDVEAAQLKKIKDLGIHYPPPSAYEQ